MNKNQLLVTVAIVFLCASFFVILIKVPALVVSAAPSYNYYMDVVGSEYQWLNPGGTIVLETTSSSTVFNDMIGACSSGYSVYVYAGSYSVDATWYIYTNSITVVFQSGAVLIAPNNFNNIILDITANSVVVSGITINGNGLNQSPAYNVLLTGSNYNCGIQLDGSSNLVENSIVYDERCDGIQTGWSDVTSNEIITNCTVYDCGANGITVGTYGGSGTDTGSHLINNIVYGCGDVGVDTQGINTIVTGNYVYDCGSSWCPMYGYANSFWGIASEGAYGSGAGTYLLIANNQIVNCGVGIYVSNQGSSYHLVSGNTISNCNMAGYAAAIYTNAAHDIIEFNSITGGSGNNWGIQVDSSASSVDVYGNTYSGCSTNYSNSGSGTMTTQPSIIALTITTSPIENGYVTVSSTLQNYLPYTFYSTVSNTFPSVSTANPIGYVFSGWSPSLPSTIPSSYTTYTGTYTTNGVTPTPTPTATPTPTVSPTPTPTIPPNNPTGTWIIQTDNNFNIVYNTGQGFNIQDVAQGITDTFTVTSGNLQGTGNLNVTSSGGVFQITPITSGTLSLTSTSPTFSITVNGLPATSSLTYVADSTYTIDWIYTNNNPPPYYAGTSNSIFYFRTDPYTTNNVTAYGLDTTDTTNPQTIITPFTAGQTVTYGFRVWIVHSNGKTTELTPGTPSAIEIPVTNTNQGWQNTTWNSPEATINLGYDALQVNIYVSLNGGSTWTDKANYISNTIISTELLQQTWTFNLYTTYNTGTSQASFTFGSATYNSNINNVGFQPPTNDQLQTYRFLNGNYILFILTTYTSQIGVAAYLLILAIPTVSLYLRHRNFGPILVLFALFGTSGVSIYFFVPAWAAIPLFMLLACGFAFLIWRITR